MEVESLPSALAEELMSAVLVPEPQAEASTGDSARRTFGPGAVLRKPDTLQQMIRSSG